MPISVRRLAGTLIPMLHLACMPMSDSAGTQTCSKECRDCKLMMIMVPQIMQCTMSHTVVKYVAVKGVHTLSAVQKIKNKGLDCF